MKQLFILFIALLLFSSCSVYQEIWNSISSNPIVEETDCVDLKIEGYNGFYEPSIEGRVFENTSVSITESLSFKSKPILSFTEIESVTKSFDTFTGKEVINMILTNKGRKIFKEYTANHIGEKLGIIFKDKLIMAPVINSEIPGGKVQITNGDQTGIEELYGYIKRLVECKRENK